MASRVQVPPVGLEFWGFLSRSRKGLSGLIVFGAILGMALGAPLVATHPPLKTLVGSSFIPPTPQFVFGTDDLGRDIYSNVLYGARTSLFVGITSVAVSALIGIMIGALAGYHGRRVDDVLMRITEVFLVIPRFVFALVVAAIFGQTIINIILAISLTSWPGFARLSRAEFLSIKERPFVEAVKVLGARNHVIMFGEILPNALPPLVPYAVLEVGTAILIEAGLGFLGVGDPNLPSWGLMLNNAQLYMRIAWWMALFPGLALFLTILGLNLLGEALNEYLNPRLRRR